MKRGSVALPLILSVQVLLVAGACKKAEPDDAPVAAPANAREPIDVMAPGGERTLRLEVQPDGYSLIDRAGWSIGRAIFDGSSVRVTDRGGNTIVTVSRTAAGFQLDDDSGAALLGTLEDEGLVLTRAGKRQGVFGGHALKLEDRTLHVIDNDAYILVVQAGDALLEVRGPVGDGAAFLAWTELSFPERLALMLFLSELS